MSQCCECKEEIRDDAIRCRHCSSIQGWRRILRAPWLTCTLMLTIVSILAAEPVKNFLDPKKADIQPAITDGDFYRTNITLTNKGTRAATLVSIKIEGRSKDGLSTTWYLRSNLDGQILEAGKSYVTTASNGDLIPGFVNRMRSAPLKQIHGFSENCRLLIDYTDINGQEFILPYPFMCDPVDWNSREVS